ncbi:MAG: FliG C-terminal domain-containing protein [Paracoccaceae bacterium]
MSSALPTQINRSDGAASAAPGPVRKLTKRQKAAIVVRLLMAEGADLSLAGMSETTLADLTLQMTTLRYIDRATLEHVIEEFLAEIDAIGLSFPGGVEDALSILESAIDADTASRLRKQAGVSEAGDPWERLGALGAEVLLPVMEEESVEVCAVLLSKLKVSKAAELLGGLPGERARRIAYAISLTGNIAPDIVRRIGLSLASQLDTQPIRAFAEGPVERVGAILNFSPAATRDDVLEGLHETDEDFATEVRRAIFTFANIPARIDPRDVPKITRDVDPAQLITALASASGEGAKATEFILSNMSQRMAGQMKEEMEALGDVKTKDGEDAQNAVVAVIRELEAAGEIFLVAEDE